MLRQHYFIIVLFCLLNPLKLYCTTPSLKDSSSELNLFARAEHALKKQDLKNYQKLLNQLESYPLYPYLIYEELKQRITQEKPTSVTLQQLKDFQTAYPDFPFHAALRNNWLTQMAKDKNWSAFVEGYRPSKKVVLECQYYFAKYQLTPNKAILDPVKGLWLVGYSQPSECDEVLSLWKKKGNFTPDLIWERFRLALENKNFELTKNLVKQLSSQEQEIARLWEKLIKNPLLINNPKILKELDSVSRNVKSKITNTEVLSIVLNLLASINAEDAASWWKAHEKDYSFSNTQKNQITRDIAVFLARQKSPLAYEWLTSLPINISDLIAQEWRVRVSLSNQDWQNVLKWINHLPPYVKQEKCWRYWKARALEKRNETAQAQIIYKQLAQTRSYYGFLSAMRLNKPFALENYPISIDPIATQQVLNMPAIKRFEQLLLLGKDHLARYEWFRATDKMNEAELRAAAKIAQKMNLYDYAILTVLKGTHRNDVPLRFPIAFQTEIKNFAAQNQIDPAWAFAIARQESSFYPATLSEAGARGLMQLMPKTADMLAKQYQIPYPSEDALYDPLINIQMGTTYLRDLKKEMFDNFILATASYNAGPHRVVLWLPKEQPMDADIWIENIPFKETREYVKNVFMFIGIYRQQLGLPTEMEVLMKPIPEKNMRAPAFHN